MPSAGFYISSSPSGTEDVDMDIVSILLGILIFSILLGLIYGIDRI